MSNPIIEYYNLIESGKEVVSKKVAKVYKYLYELVTGKIKSKYYYNEIRANHAIDFIERYCKHSKGRWANKPVILELWQKAFIGAVFGIIDKETEFRRFREALLVVAKKNGKSLLASGIALYMLIADGEGGAECYSVATKKEQAKIIWQESKNMTEKSPDLNRRVRCLTSQLAYDKTNSTFKPLSSDSNTEDGLNIYLAECDEIHAWKGVELYNIVADGISARDEPLILITTTAGFIREGAYDVKYAEAENLINGLFDDNGYKDDAFLPIIYELDDRNEWTDEKSWPKANPNLGVSKKYDYLRRKVDVAIGNPINRKNVLTKEFNIPETSSEVYFDYDDIYNPITFDLSELKPDYGIGGTDLSSTTDLTSASILFQIPTSDLLYFHTMYWLPYDLLDRRKKEDKIPYDVWYDLGLLRVSNGNKVDYDDVVSWFEEIQNDYGLYIYGHGYDSWSAQAYVKNMRDSFGDIGRPIIQGKKTLSGPMKALKAEFMSKKVNYNNNPITKWCLTNVRADIDKNENIQPAKTSNPRRRIDGFAGMLNAYVFYLDERDEYLRLIKR
jgi:phage terminase large subunit-like protein